MRPVFRGLAQAAVAVVVTGSLVAFATGTADAATAVSHSAVSYSAVDSAQPDPRSEEIATSWRGGQVAVVTGADGERYATRLVDGEIKIAKISSAAAYRGLAVDAATDTPADTTCQTAFAVATVIFAIGSAAVLTLLAAAAIIGAPALVIGGVTITVAGLTAASAALASWTAVVAQLDKLLC